MDTQSPATTNALVPYAPTTPQGPADWRWQRVQQLRNGRAKEHTSDELDSLVRRTGELLRLLDRRGIDAKPPSVHFDLQWALTIHRTVSLEREAIHAYVMANADREKIAQELGLPHSDGGKWVETYERLFFDVRSRLASKLYIRTVIDTYARSPEKTDQGLTLLKVGYHAYLTKGGTEMIDAILHPGSGSNQTKGSFDSMIRHAAQASAVSVLSARDLARDQAAAEHIAQYAQMRASWAKTDTVVGDNASNELDIAKKRMMAGLEIGLRSIKDVTPVHVTPRVKDQMRGGMDMRRIEEEIAARKRQGATQN